MFRSEKEVQQRLAVVEATQVAMQDQHERLLRLNRELVAERDELKRKAREGPGRGHAAALPASVAHPHFFISPLTSSSSAAGQQRGALCKCRHCYGLQQ